MGKYQRHVLYLVQNSNTLIRTSSNFGKFELSPFEIKIRPYAFELIAVPPRSLLGFGQQVRFTEFEIELVQ